MPSTALAENPRTAKKSAIKRASAAARRKMMGLDKDVLADLTRIYARAVEELQSDVDEYADREGTLRLEALQALLAQARARLTRLENEKLDLLDRSMTTAATMGVEPFAVDAAQLGGALPQIADQAVRFVRNFVAEDGLQLSDRIWRNDRHARRVVQEAVEQAVIQGHSASQAAQDLLSRGQAVPPDVQRKMKDASAEKIIGGIRQKVLKDPGNPYDNALRLFRTEINRAHGEAYQSAAFEHPDVIGTRFLLSPNHPETDICDMHATVNRYGLGPGVYPKDKNPFPAHPNTLSFVQVVFADEVTPADLQGKEDRITWLKRQDTATQAGVLNSRRKAQALQLDYLKENQIATPWKVLKTRFQRAGNDPEQWSDVLKSRPPPTRRRSAIKPVSDALQITGYRALLNPVLDTINRVHDDGELPKIPVKRSSARQYYGAYVHKTFGGDPVDIRISQHGDHKMLTLAHEIGHFIDHQGVGVKGRFASTRDDLFQGWRDAVDGSEAVRSLKELARGPAVLDFGDQGKYRVDQSHTEYLLRTHEIWARSYAQYIATNGGDREIKRQLDDLVQRQKTSLVRYAAQWDAEDFKPIATAIDRVFNELGWKK